MVWGWGSAWDRAESDMGVRVVTGRRWVRTTAGLPSGPAGGRGIVTGRPPFRTSHDPVEEGRCPNCCQR